MDQALIALEQPLAIGNLESYIRFVRDIPVLSLEEELELAKQLHDHQDLSAAKRLILANLRFVVRMAYTYQGYGLALADLIQEGTIGLMKAVKRYDHKQGVRLVTFAVHWIKAEMHDFIIKNWRIVKIATTKTQRKIFFNLRKKKKSTGWLTSQEAKAIAEDLQVSESALYEMDMRLMGHDYSFDAPTDEDDEQAFAPSHYLEDMRYSPSATYEQEHTSEQNADNLHSALAKLDERSQIILNSRWLAEDKATLHDLAAQFSVSAERIRQLEQSALKKLKTALAE